MSHIAENVPYRRNRSEIRCLRRTSVRHSCRNASTEMLSHRPRPIASRWRPQSSRPSAMLADCPACRSKPALRRRPRDIWCMVADATAEYHTFRQHTNVAKRTLRIIVLGPREAFCAWFAVVIILTELLFFGPNAMAGDAFSVSDEFTSLCCSEWIGSSDSPSAQLGRSGSDCA